MGKSEREGVCRGMGKRLRRRVRSKRKGLRQYMLEGEREWRIRKVFR